MKLKRLVLNNFRNYENIAIQLDDADSVFLIGENGQGKTNFLESLYYLSYGNSFRTKKDDEILKHDTIDFKILGIFEDEDIEKKIDISYKHKKKKILYNDTLVKNRREILNAFPALIFKHSDIFFVTGSPEYQRQYVDQILVLNHEDYARAFQEYKRALQQKNAALKHHTLDMLHIYNNILIRTGTKLIRYRARLVEYINSVLSGYYSEIIGENVNLTLDYQINWNVNFMREDQTVYEDIKKKIASLYSQEIKFKTCMSGPHRDQVKIYTDGYEFKSIGSTGQVRAVSLLLRSIQASYYFARFDKTMIYLFDDVLLELDTEKQKRFLQNLPHTSQSFFTFLPEEHLPYQVRSVHKRYLKVEKGNIIELKK